VNEAMPHDHGAMTTAMPMMSGKSGVDAIQWDDPTNSDKVNNVNNVTWKIVDQKTGKTNMEINDWIFKKGQFVKIRFTNDTMAMHVMQHPIHFHGQKFIVLSNNGVPNMNMVWKDTALVLPGEYIDVLVDMSNTGVWMAHCHIVEHLFAGMMISFRVEERDGSANGDDYRKTVSPAPVAQTSQNPVPGMEGMDMNHMNHGAMNMGQVQKDAPVPVGSYNFADQISDSSYTVSSDIQLVETGKDTLLALTFSDSQGNGMSLDEKLARPLSVTFVHNDNSTRFVTYPGNTVFPDASVPANVPGTPGFDESKPHSHSSMFFSIPTAYAHGGVDDGHIVGGGRTYSVPVRFPVEGTYRGFVSFVLAGEQTARIATFDVEVGSASFNINNFGWSPTVQWWILLIVSLCIMIPLVFGVKKYINSNIA